MFPSTRSLGAPNPAPPLFPQHRQAPNKTHVRKYNSRTHASNNEDDQEIDIDDLAKFLSSEAERMRRQTGGDDADSNDNPPSKQEKPMLNPFGWETKSREAEILASIGDGGLYASEFELLQELGSISVQQIEAPSDDDVPFSTGERSATAAVIAYTAMYYSGMPFQDPVVTFVKEYLPGAGKAVACNELLVLQHLSGLPDINDKWKVASAVLSSKSPPVVELIGYFLAGPSERAAMLDPELDVAKAGDTIWIVQKWDGLAPLALYPSAQQTSGIGLGRLFSGSSSSSNVGGSNNPNGSKAINKDRARMLKAITRGCLNAVGYCHDKSVIHGSLGSGSFLLSTYDDSSASRLVVKLDNFGFARKITTLAESRQLQDTPFELGRKEDLKQLAVVLLECILSSLSRNNGSNTSTSEASSADAIRRVFGDVFGWDIEQYKQYVNDDPDWEDAVVFLDAEDGAGWKVLEELILGNKTAYQILMETAWV